MKQLFFILCICLSCCLQMKAQDRRLFEGEFVNTERHIFMSINLYDKNMKIPGQEVLGEVLGYLGTQKDSRLWLMMDAKIVSPQQAQISIINDYGSEELDAMLVFTNDSVCILKQSTGSPIKFAINNKWVKIPKQLTLKRKKK